jgi:hypothetical protein
VNLINPKCKKEIPMRVLLRVADIFIDTFGITRPSPEERDRAARYIAVLLLLVVLLIFSVFAIAVFTPQR